MREFELYVPLTYNDGTRIEREKIESIKDRLFAEFRALTYFPQPNTGLWETGGVIFRDQIIIIRFLAGDVRKSRRFLRQFKADLKRELKQHEILIVERKVTTL